MVATVNDTAHVLRMKGVVVCCNARIGAPRFVAYAGHACFEAQGGTVARGLCDDVVGFGAFAVEKLPYRLSDGVRRPLKIPVRTSRVGVDCCRDE